MREQRDASHPQGLRNAPEPKGARAEELRVRQRLPLPVLQEAALAEHSEWKEDSQGSSCLVAILRSAI